MASKNHNSNDLSQEVDKEYLNSVNTEDLSKKTDQGEHDGWDFNQSSTRIQVQCPCRIKKPATCSDNFDGPKWN
jgi:hypothetical protein